MSLTSRLWSLVVIPGFVLLVAGCPGPPPDLADDPEAYIESPRYRRGILERDLREQQSSYARDRLVSYGQMGLGWEVLPEWDPPSRALRNEDLERFLAGEQPEWDDAEAESLEPFELPATQEEWVELGRRVFFEYPLRSDPIYSTLVGLEGGLEDSGFIEDEGSWVGLRLFRRSGGVVTVGNTCAQCHAGRNPDGTVTGSLANRQMDIGAARLLVQGLTPGSLPPELESTAVADLDRLGPGRGDVQSDGQFNPFAFPDMGGLGDMPILQHNATWDQGGVATLAVRCETLFITASARRTRIPRVLSWALSEFFHSLPAPPPGLEGEAVPEEAEAGALIFDEAGCADCHVPPLYTSDSPVPATVVGTDPSATESPSRGTGNYRVPSLRGVAWTAPYLHHGAVSSLEELLDPGRLEEEPGHEFGHDLSAEEKAALIAFLQTI